MKFYQQKLIYSVRKQITGYLGQEMGWTAKEAQGNLGGMIETVCPGCGYMGIYTCQNPESDILQ